MKAVKSTSNKTFDELPEEMRTNIFSFLPFQEKLGLNNLQDNYHRTGNTRQNYSALAAASAVSRTWRSTAENPFLWRHFCLLINTQKSSDNVLTIIKTPRFANLRRIHFMYCINPTTISRPRVEIDTLNT